MTVTTSQVAAGVWACTRTHPWGTATNYHQDDPSHYEPRYTAQEKAEADAAGDPIPVGHDPAVPGGCC